MTAIEPELFLAFANYLNNIYEQYIYEIVQRTLFFSKLLTFFLESVPRPRSWYTQIRACILDLSHETSDGKDPHLYPK